MQHAAFPAEILQRAARIKLACFDVDGVLSDGKLGYGEDGREYKAFHVHDGLGLKLAREAGIEVALVTARSSPIVAARGIELGLRHVHQGQRDKRACVETLRAELGLDWQAIAYTGDDLPDLACMQRAGLAVAVANAHPWVLERAHWRTRLPGGHGAAREVCDLLLQAQHRTDAVLARFLAP
jgi:3-deoxy-D-manno-octulosonate 8-phosphate phosphatase (KDO 8-P phosphatase)